MSKKIELTENQLGRLMYAAAALLIEDYLFKPTKDLQLIMAERVMEVAKKHAESPFEIQDTPLVTHD